MFTEGNLYEAVDFGHHQDNPLPSYDNSTPQSLPGMNATQPTFYPPPPGYGEVLSEWQPGGVVTPPPYHINNPSEGTFSGPMEIPSPEMAISLPQPNNNNNQKKIIQKPPMYNPELSTPQISELTEPKASPSPTTIPEKVPPLQDPQTCPVPGTAIDQSVQPMVVTTQTTRSPTPRANDKWWCFKFSIVMFIVYVMALVIAGLCVIPYGNNNRTSIAHYWNA